MARTSKHIYEIVVILQRRKQLEKTLKIFIMSKSQRIFNLIDQQGTKKALETLKAQYNNIESNNRVFNSSLLRSEKISMVYTIKEVNRRLEIETNKGILIFY